MKINLINNRSRLNISRGAINIFKFYLQVKNEVMIVLLLYAVV